MDEDFQERSRLGWLKLIGAALTVAAMPAFAGSGTLDPTFGDRGHTSLPVAARVPLVFLPLSDGRFLLGVQLIRSLDIQPLYMTSLFRFQPDGSFDPTFGTGGEVELGPFAAPSRRLLAETPSGFAFLSDYEVQQFSANGVLLWKTRVDFRNVDSQCDGYTHVAKSVAAGPNGSVVVAISLERRGGSSGSVALDQCVGVMRLRSDGTPDPSFGIGGKVVSRPGLLNPGDMFVDRQGRISLVGIRSGGFLMRLLPDGRPDEGFAPLGIKNLAIRGGADCPPFVFRLSATAEGIYFLLHCYPVMANEVIRFSPSGELDDSFGVNGVAHIAGYFADEAVRQPDGGVILSKWYETPGELTITKLTATGRLDAGFGGGGSARYRPAGRYAISGRFAVQRDGHVLLASRDIENLNFGFLLPGNISLMRALASARAVEYYNSILGHYFLTTDGEEARNIDRGGAGPGWSRTGQSFEVGGPAATCRFYGTPGVGPNSHFFTADPVECEQVKRDPGWFYEGTGLYVAPEAAQGCGAGLRGVHRLYNNRWRVNDSNHRFVVDLSLVAPMQASGWIYEGPVFCVPQ